MAFVYFYLIQIILFSMNHLFAHSLMFFKYWYVSLTIQLNISHLFTLLNVKTVLFQTIQLSISTQFKSQTVSIWSIDSTLSGATTPGQSGRGSDGNKGVLHIPQSSSINEASPYKSCVTSRTLVGGVLPLCRDAVIFCSLSWLGQ